MFTDNNSKSSLCIAQKTASLAHLDQEETSRDLGHLSLLLFSMLGLQISRVVCHKTLHAISVVVTPKEGLGLFVGHSFGGQ